MLNSLQTNALKKHVSRPVCDIQEALHGEFNLSKRPKRFAIRTASSALGQASRRGIGTKIAGEAAASQETIPPQIGASLGDPPVTQARNCADKELAACPTVPSY